MYEQYQKSGHQKPIIQTRTAGKKDQGVTSHTQAKKQSPIISVS